METSAGGDRKAWFTIRMQAPNNAQPRADDRVTWRKGKEMERHDDLSQREID